MLTKCMAKENCFRRCYMRVADECYPCFSEWVMQSCVSPVKLIVMDR